MEVTEEKDLSRLLSFLHHQFCVVVDWVQLGAASYPLSVQVLPDQGASVVANDDTIWVEHWNDLEDVVVSQEASLLFVADKEVNDPLHDPAGIAFTRVDSRREYDSFAHSDVFRSAAEVGDNEHVDIVASKRLAEYRLPDLVLVLVRASVVDQLTDVCVGVRVAMSKVDGVVVV